MLRELIPAAKAVPKVDWGRIQLGGRVTAADPQVRDAGLWLRGWWRCVHIGSTQMLLLKNEQSGKRSSDSHWLV